MGRTACTEPQCLYKGDLYLTFIILQDSIFCICEVMRHATLDDYVRHAWPVIYNLPIVFDICLSNLS